MGYKLNYSSGNSVVGEPKYIELVCPICNGTNLTDGRKCPDCDTHTPYITCPNCQSKTVSIDICVDCGHEWH